MIGNDVTNTPDWAERLSTGAREIDSTNECLQFVLAEHLLTKISCRGNAVSCPKIEDIERFLVGKFTYEENLMETTGFPDLEAHRASHADLLARMRTMRRELICGAYDAKEIYTFLTDWAVGHIETFDTEFGCFLTSRT